MALDPKDYFSALALVVSAASYYNTIRDKRRSMQLTFEQKRQELLLIRTQGQVIMAGVVRDIEAVERECELKLGKKHTVTLNVTIYKQRIEINETFSGAVTLGEELFPPERATSQKVLAIEKKIGVAKRGLEELAEKVREAGEFKKWARERLDEASSS